MYTLVNDTATKGRELRVCVVETLQDLMNHNDKVIALEADLGGASGFTKLQKTNPNQFIQCGIAEANMVGVSADLSVTGFIPFMHTFGPFATRRVFDQLFISGAYAHTTLNIYGSDPGFTVGANGGTHTTWEDVALMRMIPHALVCDAADDVQLEWIIRNFITLKGIHYVRANRKAVRNIYEKGSTFTFGKGNILHKGKDVLLIVAGQLVADALDAAYELKEQGISVEVVDMFTIKPIDVELIVEESKGKKAIITLENHSIIGGLGSAVAEVMAEENIAIPLKRMGVNEQFGQVGTPEWLQEEYHLCTKDIVETIHTALQR